MEVGRPTMSPGWAVKGAALLALGVLALTLRWHPPRNEVLYPDAAVYMRQAQGYLEGQASIAPPWRGLPAGGPVYPALTALVTPLAGDVERAGVWVSRAAGVSVAVTLGAVGWGLAGPVAGMTAGVLGAVEPRLVHFSETDLTESLFYALALGSLAWALRLGTAGRRAGAWRSELGLGALLGLVSLTRAVGLSLLPAVALAAVVGGRFGTPAPWYPLLARGARIVVGGLLVVGLYQGYAWSHGWTTAFDTHSPHLLSRPHAPSAGQSPPAADLPGDVAAGPEVRAARHAVRKVARALGVEVRTLAANLPPLVFLLALAGLGSRLLLRRQLGTDLLLLGVSAAYLLALALFETHLPRYLVVVFPVLFLYAGCGVAAAWEAVLALAARFAAPPPWLGPAAAWGLAGVIATVAALQTQAVFSVPHRSYAELRDLARDVTRDAAPPAPVAVYADHAFFPYYAHGYWRGPPVAPEATRSLGDGGRVVVLDSAHAGDWPVAWEAPALEQRDTDGFVLADQRYFPRRGQLVTVYVDAPVRPEAPGGTGKGVPDGVELLRSGRFAEATRALAQGRPEVARRARGVMEMVEGQFFPERLTRAWDDLDSDPVVGGAALPAPSEVPVRWRWSLPPGEMIAGVDDAATAWNRAAVALALGNPAGAAGEIPALTRAFGREPRNLYLIGMVLLGLGRVQEALWSLEPARKGLPDDLGVEVAWANAMATTGRLGAAETAYRRVIERDPYNFGVWLNLYQVLAQARKWEAADEVRRQMAALKPTPQERDRLDQLIRQVEKLRGLG